MTHSEKWSNLKQSNCDLCSVHLVFTSSSSALYRGKRKTVERGHKFHQLHRTNHYRRRYIPENKYEDAILGTWKLLERTWELNWYIVLAISRQWIAQGQGPTSGISVYGYHTLDLPFSSKQISLAPGVVTWQQDFFPRLQCDGQWYRLSCSAWSRGLSAVYKAKRSVLPKFDFSSNAHKKFSFDSIVPKYTVHSSDPL